MKAHVSQHHDCTEQQSSGVGQIFSCYIWSSPMNLGAEIDNKSINILDLSRNKTQLESREMWTCYSFKWLQQLFRVNCLKSKQHTDSNMATPFAPIFPLGVTPNPPINPAQRSLWHLTYKVSSRFILDIRCWVDFRSNLVAIFEKSKYLMPDPQRSPCSLGLRTTLPIYSNIN